MLSDLAPDPGLVRRRLADGLVDSLREAPGVVAVLLGGSTAQGRADGFSDLDLHVITAAPTPPDMLGRWTRRHADPGSVWYTGQAVRTGGTAETVLCQGIDVTVTTRERRAVDRGVAVVASGLLADQDFELAYGHELVHALPLADPSGLLVGWQRELARPVQGRAERLQAVLRAELAALPMAPPWPVYRAATLVLHVAAAASGCYYPGPKLTPASVPPGLAPILAEVLLALTAALPPAERVRCLLALAAVAAPPLLVDRLTLAAAGDETPLEQVLNAGCDAAGGRLMVAVRREAPVAFWHYLSRSLEAASTVARRLGAPDLGEQVWGLTATAGVKPATMPDIARSLADCWRALLAAAGQQGHQSSYASAALAVWQ